MCIYVYEIMGYLRVNPSTQRIPTRLGFSLPVYLFYLVNTTLSLKVLDLLVWVLFVLFRIIQIHFI